MSLFNNLHVIRKIILLLVSGQAVKVDVISLKNVIE